MAESHVSQPWGLQSKQTWIMKVSFPIPSPSFQSYEDQLGTSFLWGWTVHEVPGPTNSDCALERKASVSNEDPSRKTFDSNTNLSFPINFLKSDFSTQNAKATVYVLQANSRNGIVTRKMTRLCRERVKQKPNM